LFNFPGDDYQDQHSSRVSSLVTSLCIRSIQTNLIRYWIRQLVNIKMVSFQTTNLIQTNSFHD
jgi:hypothetical protein